MLRFRREADPLAALDVRVRGKEVERAVEQRVCRAQRMQKYAYGLRRERGAHAANRLDLWRGSKHIGPLPQYIEYAEKHLTPRAQHWQQAMLSAAIWFITEELDIENIWYHSHQTGAKLKHIEYSQPPRSLYSQLPKQFCFEKRRSGPEFITAKSQKYLKRRIEIGKENFWHLAF